MEQLIEILAKNKHHDVTLVNGDIAVIIDHCEKMFYGYIVNGDEPWQATWNMDGEHIVDDSKLNCEYDIHFF